MLAHSWLQRRASHSFTSAGIQSPSRWILPVHILGWAGSPVSLFWTDIPFSHPLVRVRPGKEHGKGRSSGPRTKSRQSLVLPCWGHTTAEADGSRVTWVQHRPRVDTT